MKVLFCVYICLFELLNSLQDGCLQLEMSRVMFEKNEKLRHFWESCNQIKKSLCRDIFLCYTKWQNKVYIYTLITNFHMLYYFGINECIVTTVRGVSDTITRRATLPLQLVIIELRILLNTCIRFNWTCIERPQWSK